MLAAGSAAARFTRQLAWRIFDPTGISSGLGSVGNVLAASAVRWDAIGYLTIGQHGHTTAGSTRWFPLNPLLIHVFAPVVASPVIAGVLISLVAFGIGLTLGPGARATSFGSRSPSSSS